MADEPRSFEQLLSDPDEQFDKRSELLASIEAYSKAVPATASGPVVTDDREPFREARAAGLQKRHEQRLENATYTAAEVKVLTEAALRLGRKEAGEEIAEALERSGEAMDSQIWLSTAGRRAAAIARSIASQPSPDATSGRTDPEEPK